MQLDQGFPQILLFVAVVVSLNMPQINSICNGDKENLCSKKGQNLIFYMF